MALLKVKIKLLSPVILSSYVPDNNLTGTHDFIPGSSILGLFAVNYINKKHLKKEAHLNEDFNAWFLKEKLIFTNAYITEKEEYGEIAMLPTPLCIKKQKNNDIILNTLLNQIDEQMVSISPYSYIDGARIKTLVPEKKINFHHHRERVKGHTTDGGMFNYEALLPGQVFQGEIIGAVETLKKFKENFEDKFIARLGKSRNTEYGKVEVKLMRLEEEKTLVFTEKEFKNERSIFITFISPCILLNAYGFSDPSIATLENYLGGIWEKDTFTIVDYELKIDRIENYLSVWRMKRPLERAIMAGSTFKLYFCNRLSYAQVYKGLDQIVGDGIGKRRGEGFGRVKINMTTDEEYFEQGLKKRVIKPTGPLPTEAKKVFVHVINSFIKEEFGEKVYHEVENFSLLPSNSLLGKLGLMLVNSPDYQFKRTIDELRDKAETQLKECKYDRKSSLYHYIKSFDVIKIIEGIYNRNNSYSKLAKFIDYDIKNEKEILLKLWKQYFTVLFKLMRKKQQSSTKKEALNNE